MRQMLRLTVTHRALLVARVAGPNTNLDVKHEPLPQRPRGARAKLLAKQATFYQSCHGDNFRIANVSYIDGLGDASGFELQRRRMKTPLMHSYTPMPLTPIMNNVEVFSMAHRIYFVWNPWYGRVAGNFRRWADAYNWAVSLLHPGDVFWIVETIQFRS